MIKLYKEGRSLEEIAELYDISVDKVEELRELEGWDDYLEADTIQKYADMVDSLPYPDEICDLIAQLYFLKNKIQTMVDILPEPASLIALQKLEMYISRFTKSHISTKGMRSMTMEEATHAKVEWLGEYKKYMLEYSITEVEVIDVKS